MIDSLLLCARCNHDVSWTLVNAAVALLVCFYISKYLTKPVRQLNVVRPVVLQALEKLACKMEKADEIAAGRVLDQGAWPSVGANSRPVGGLRSLLHSITW